MHILEKILQSQKYLLTEILSFKELLYKNYLKNNIRGMMRITMQIMLKIFISKTTKLYIFLTRHGDRISLYNFINRETILWMNQCRMKRRELYLAAITIRGPHDHRRRSHHPAFVLDVETSISFANRRSYTIGFIVSSFETCSAIPP